MSTPTLSSATSRMWQSNRDPSSNEEIVADVGNFWLNTTTNNLFDCLNNTPQSLVWRRRSSATPNSSFTPVIAGTTSAGVGTYSVQIGRYQIINDMAFAVINLQWSAHTGTGNLRISGLPFSPYNLAVQNQIIDLQNITLPALSLTPIVRTNGNLLDVYTMVAAGANAAVALPSSGILRLTASFFL